MKNINEEYGNKDKELMEEMTKESKKNRNKYKKLKYVLVVLVITMIIFGFFNYKEIILSKLITDRPSQIALRYYIEKYGDQDTEGLYAMKRRLGCHEEILIYNKEGQQVMKLSYANGRIYEMD